MEQPRVLTVGASYLTPTGNPVQLLDLQGDVVLVQSLRTDNRFLMPVTYPLRPMEEKPSGLELRPTPYKEATRPTLGERKRPLAPIIDALLSEGKLTIRGIAREVQRQASSACSGKNVRANIRARIYWLQRRGMRLYRDDAGRVLIRHDMADVGGISGGGEEIPEAAAGRGAAVDRSCAGGPQGEL
jgi:hypothetical protein